MSREVRRVPLDFDWPLNTVWKGYVRPSRLDDAPCPAGRSCVYGQTPARAWVETVCRLLLMLDEDRFSQLNGSPIHPYFRFLPGPGFLRPSPDIAEFATGLAGREPLLTFHDCTNQWAATEKVIAAAGLDPKTWGVCPDCGGTSGVEAYPGQRAEAEAWTATQPPVGDGWQVWETVSEGSPITPVLESREALIGWLAEHYRPVGREDTLSVAEAAAFVDSGYAPTLVFDGKRGLRSGEEAALGLAEDRTVAAAEGIAFDAVAQHAEDGDAV